MAEIAAGVVAAEQIVSTGLEAAAAVAVAKPSLPLKAVLSQLASTPGDDASTALARAHHSVTVIDDKAYIFGGEGPDGKLCSTDVHAVSLPSANSKVDYACYPAFPLLEAETGASLVPTPRAKHAACARGKYVLIHGGCGSDGAPLNESCLWLWDSETLKWSKVQTTSQIGAELAPRFDHHIFLDTVQDLLILHGGRTHNGQSASTETWLYTFDSLAWTQLPASPAPSTAAALVDNTLYCISQDSAMSGVVQHLNLQANTVDREKPGSLVWEAVTFPTNPLTPGPRPREGGALLPITTGLGRRYLIHLFGEETGQGEKGEKTLLADIWTLQPPAYGLSAASIKDKIRDKMPGVDSGEMSWAELELIPAEQMDLEGKAHPGPRAFFGADAFAGRNLVFWGGVSAKGKEGDGWVLQIQ